MEIETELQRGTETLPQCKKTGTILVWKSIIYQCRANGEKSYVVPNG